MNELFPGLIVGVGKNAVWIVLDGENVPRVSAIKRTRGQRAMPVPGDRAEAQLLEDGTALIQRLTPRVSTLQRHAVRGRPKAMAANVDTLVTVTSLADPQPRLLTLDQLLAYTELEGIGAIVVLTKPDRAAPSARLELTSLYHSLRYPTLVVNPKTGQNIEELRASLAGRHAMLAGVSGVGKSSIFRALGGDATVGAVSRAGLGKQTTTAARLYRLPSGFLIDSPGVSEFGLGRLPADRVAGAFREIHDAAPGCRFSDCTHGSEPGCAVRLAVSRGHIAESRYESYRQILQMCYTAPRAEY